MMSREEMERHLSVLRTEEILHLLRDDTLLEIAERYFASLGMNSTQHEVHQPVSINTPISTFADQSKPPSTDKAKRPLNAFMAFRSMYHPFILFYFIFFKKKRKRRKRRIRRNKLATII
jgi:lipopolysaccharide biosynthesis glycosyltransferase